MRPLIARLWRDKSGITVVEFALIAPILAIFAVGTIEFGRLILLTQKLQNASFILADLAARDKTLSETQLDNIFLALNKLIQPFEFTETGSAVVTSVHATVANTPVVRWQRTGAGELEEESRLGTPGGAATLPETLSIAAGETIIAAEVFYNFEPLFGMTAHPRVLRKVAYFKPRLGTLDTLLP